jgi:hypothetical protein
MSITKEYPDCRRIHERASVHAKANVVIKNFPYTQVTMSDISTGGTFLYIDLDCFDIFDCLSRFDGAPAIVIVDINDEEFPLPGTVCRTNTNNFSIKFKSSPRTRLIVSWIIEDALADDDFAKRVQSTLRKELAMSSKVAIPKKAPPKRQALPVTQKENIPDSSCRSLKRAAHQPASTGTAAQATANTMQFNQLLDRKDEPVIITPGNQTPSTTRRVVETAATQMLIRDRKNQTARFLGEDKIIGPENCSSQWSLLPKENDTSKFW